MSVRALGRLVGVLILVVGCDRHERQARSAPPPPPPPVTCSEYPGDKQDIVSCRSYVNEQAAEVFARSKQVAATTAISQGFSHIQWLSAETRVETALGNAPVECKAKWGGAECTGGVYEMPVGLISVTRFAFLTAADAQARLSDPLIPAERRPIDARATAASAQPH